MSIAFAIELVRNGVLQVLMMAAPMILVGMGVGLIISIFQATTSLQEQTLSFVPKIAAILGSVALFGPWILNSILDFTIRLFNQIPQMAG